MSDMFWISLELSNPGMGLNTSFYLLIMKLNNASKFYEFAKADNTGARSHSFDVKNLFTSTYRVIISRVIESTIVYV